MNIDSFLGRIRSSNYDCLSFTCEVWKELTGEDLRIRLDNLLATASGSPSIVGAKFFEKLKDPTDPCLVLMRQHGCSPHIGVYTQGRLLHLNGDGVQHSPLDVIKSYTRVEFFR